MPGADRTAPVPRGRLIRKYVGLFAAVVSVALLISGAFEIWFSYQDHKALLLRLQREQAETAATRISQFVREIEGQLGWTTQLPWSEAPLDQRRLDALRLLRQAPAITELAQLDPAGKEQLRVSRLATDVVGSGADFSKDETFTEALARKVHHSPVYFRRESEPYMTIALAGAQRDAGVSIAEVNLKQIWDIVAGIRVGERGVAYVVDAAGRLIAHPDISLVLRNTSLAQLPHVAAARAGSDEVKEARDGQGQPVLTAHAPIPTTGWLVFAESPLDEAYASLSRSLRRLGLLLLAAVGLAGLAGTLLARRMVVPIQALRTAAARIGAGELDQRIDIRTGDELEALAGAFNTMAGRLRESYSNLEQTVEQRTGELSEALEQQTATADVLKAVSRSAFDLQAVLDTLAESAAHLCAADQVVLTRLRDGRHHMDATFGLSDEFRDYLEHNPYGEGRGTVTGRAIDEGRPVQILDVLSDPEYTLLTGQKLGGWRSALGVPLLRDGKPIGALALLRRDVQAFTSKQVELVETFADQAVIAIENVRLFDELQARTKELTEALQQQVATGDILRAIASSPTDIAPVLKAVAQSACQLCEAYDAVVLLRDGDDLVFDAHHGPIPINLERWPLNRHWTAGRAVLDRVPVHVEDLSKEAGEFPDGYQMARQMGHRTTLSVPLLREGEGIGALVVRRTEVQPFSPKQIALLQTFADQAVIAIENVRLFDEVQARTRELTEALQQQTATAEVLKVISRTAFELQPVLDVLVQSAMQLCGADSSFLFRREGEVYRMSAGSGFSPEYTAFMREQAIALGRNTLVGRTAITAATVHIPDVLVDAEYTWSEAQRRGGFRAMLGVPLLREGTPIGILSLMRKTPRSFAVKEIELVTTFADQAVIAIENVRLFDEVQARTRALAEALEQQTATSDVLKVISGSPNDLQPIFASIAQTARRLCKADIASIVALRAGEYRLVATDGVRNEQLQQLLSEGPIPLDRGSITGRVVLERRTIQVEDVQADAEFKLFIGVANDDRRSMLGVPLMLDDEVVGIIVMSRYVVQRFSDKQIELIETFADQAVIAIQNVRLFDEVQARTGELTEALRYQTATADVLQVISRSAFDLQSVLDVLIESACRLCGAEHAFLFQRSGEVYRVAASHGFTAEFVEWMKLQRVSPGRGTLVGRVALEGEIVHIPDATVDPEYTWHEALAIGKMRTMLGVPLLRDGQPIGSLSLVRLVVKPFTDRQIELVKTFADQAVIAIENARLFGEVQARTRELARSVEELQALSDVGRAVTSTLDVKEVLSTIVSRAVELSGADAGAIYKYRKSSRTFRLAEACNMGDELVSALKSIRIDAEGTAMGDAARTLQPVMVADLAHRKSYPVRDISLAAGFRSALIVPLAVPERTLGALVLQRREVGEFPASIVRLTQTFANQSVLAIQNARFFQELAEKSEELRLASQHKSQFLANMSHELRTPLNAILGYAELLIDGIYGEMPEKPRAVLDRVQQNGQHLLSLINDVLDLSKIEAGELKLTIDDYALPSLVQSAVAATDSLARTKGLVLITDVPENLPVGRGDARRLSQVLLNLVGNAIKFTDTGEVTIAASAPNDRFLIAVRDTGPGISAADQEKIFEEFQQIDSSSTREKGGSGLGLAIAKQIVEMHGGQISVSSALGKGSTFCIEIPVRAVAQESAS
nr:GAF domain-containing protein [Bosea sp. LC85]